MTRAWLGDACSLVDAMRAGELSPSEALEALPAALGAPLLNAFSFRDADAPPGLMLFDVALTAERERPWPLVAPGAPM